MSEIAVSDARATLPQIVERIERGEEITLTRHGKPVAVLVHPDRLQLRRHRDTDLKISELRDVFEQARSEDLVAAAPKPADWAEDLVAEIRSGRASR